MWNCDLKFVGKDKGAFWVFLTQNYEVSNI